MKYFVSADVHGFFDEWMTALQKQGFDENNPEHKLIVCGDLFDRGRQAKQTQEFVMKMLAKNKIILVKGNHEDLALDLVDNYARYIYDVKSSHHYHNGTFQTFLDLTGLSFNEATECFSLFRNSALDTDYIKTIIPKMKNYYETEHYVFVHAWIPFYEGYRFRGDWRKANERDWMIARWAHSVYAYMRGAYLRDKTLVFGHWHCSDFWAYKDPKKYGVGGKPCYKPYITKEIVALDAYTVVSKKVNVFVVDD